MPLRPETFSPATYYGFNPEYEDGLRWLLSVIYFHRVAVLHKDRRDEFVFLSAKLLAKMVGDDLKGLREDAVNAGLIECDNSYVPPGHGPAKCKGYRLGPALKGVKFRRWAGDGAVYINRYKKFKLDWIADCNLDDLGKYLRKWLLRVKVTKDVDQALKQMPDEKKELAQHQIELIRDGMIKTSFCDYGRFHSNYTRLCSEVRQHLSIDGERLYEIDIVSSQVLLVAELVASQNQYTTTDGFIEDLKAGRVYEKFQAHFGYETRREAKDEFFHTIYGGIRQTRFFAEVWPSAGKVLKAIKQERGYAEVARMMQRRESNILLRRAVDRLRRDHPEVPVATVHDSILTTSEYLVLVKSVLMEAFADFPFKPILRIKGDVH